MIIFLIFIYLDLKDQNDKFKKVQSEREKLIEIVEENISTKEKEVKLRIKFENKINSLHAINRVTQELYDRANESLGMLDLYKLYL